MGERRKRKSLWDVESETTHLSGRNDLNSLTEKEHSHNAATHYHELLASELHTSVKPGDHSGHQSWKSVEQKADAMDSNDMKRGQNVPEGKEVGGQNRDFRNTSTGFGEIEQHKYDKPEIDRSHSDRYVGRGRSRSRSRNRGRSRSRSRNKGRSRSRSFSRSKGTKRERGRSRSRDRRSLPDKSSQICKDFAAGRCRRGRNCRFFHPENVAREDAGHLSCNTGESWRKSADPDQILKHLSGDVGTDSGTCVSDSFHGQLDEQFPKIRNAGHCKDFMKGKCRWGETCRFSHHFGSDEASGKGTRHTNFDKDTGKQNEKRGKPLCKYFAAGKCDRDGCRFSHEDSNFNSTRDRPGEVTNEHNFHHKSVTWNGPTWDDPIATSNNVKPATGWLGITNDTTDADTTDAKNENSWGCSVENENKGFKIPEWTDNIDQGNTPVPYGGSGGEVWNDGYFAKENLSTRQVQNMLHGSVSQNQEGHSALPEEQSFSMTAWQQGVSPIPQIQQQHHGVVENSLGNSSILNGTDSVQNVHSMNPTNGSSGDLEEPETNPVVPSSLHSQLQNDQKAFPMTDILERNPPHYFPNSSSSEQYSQLKSSTTAVSGEHVTLVTTPNVLLDQRFVNEPPQKNADTEGFNYGRMAPFSIASGNVPFAKTNNVQLDPVKVFHNRIVPTESDRGMDENGNCGEPDNEMLSAHASALSDVCNKPDDSKVGHPGSPNLEEETAQGNRIDASRAASNENKRVTDSKNAEILDNHGKPEENTGKDDKGTRLFKNSLIEFVKDILKPTWKEGKMSREAYKNIVKKVVDKVTSTIQADHIPKTQEKVDQYLVHSKPKIAKLVKAYVERSFKEDS